MNLEAYLDRIHYRRARTTTPDVLEALVAAHMRWIPFENLDVLLGQPPRLDLETLEDKLVTRRRGGYCYEHATLFAAALTALGFPVKTHSARVVMITPRDQAPRTHMFVTVGEHMLDPGFGGLAPHVPVPLDGTPAGNHRLVREMGELALYAGDKRLWISSFEHDQPIDFVMANHFTATYPTSPFVNRIMMKAYTNDGDVSVSNRDVTITAGGESRTLVLENRRALRELTAMYFGFDLPAIDSLRVPAIPDWST